MGIGVLRRRMQRIPPAVSVDIWHKAPTKLQIRKKNEQLKALHAAFLRAREEAVKEGKTLTKAQFLEMHE